MRTLLLALALALTVLAGCGARAVQVRGISPLNRNAEGESTPVDLRLYLLRHDQAFARAGFTALWTDPARTLGSDLLGEAIVVTVLPGEAGGTARLVDLGPGSADAAWLGVQILARHEGDLPRTLLLPMAQAAGTVIEAHGYGLRVAGKR